MAQATSKEKMDAILGITDGKSIDDFLSDLELDTNKIKDTMEVIDENVTNAVKSIDEASVSIKSQDGEYSLVQMKNMELSLKEIEEMISLSKDIFKHIATNILANDLIDSELVQSASNLLEGIHLNIREFIDLYKYNKQYIDKIKFSMLQHEQKKELLAIKHRYDLEKLNKNSNDNNDCIDVAATYSFNSEAIIKQIDDLDNNEQ